MAVYNYSVLKTFYKGHLLITDGKKLAWVIKRAQRKDGTFGDGAKRALEESKIQGSSMEDYDAFQHQIVSVVNVSAPEGESEKAWKLWLPYGPMWFPKSLCSFEKNKEDENYTLSGPRWLMLKNGFIEESFEAIA